MLGGELVGSVRGGWVSSVWSRFARATPVFCSFCLLDVLPIYLTGANLAHAEFDFANLAHADLRRADLTHSSLCFADLHIRRARVSAPLTSAYRMPVLAGNTQRPEPIPRPALSLNGVAAPHVAP